MQKIISKTATYFQTAIVSTLLLASTCSAATITEIRMPTGFQQQQRQQEAEDLMKKYNVVLLVDSSKSMGYSCSAAHDAFTAVVGGEQKDDIASSVSDFLGNIGFETDDLSTRWDWCKARANELAEAGKANSDGLRLILFGEKASIHDNVDQQAIEKIFDDEHPHGGTFAARSLETEFDNYFAHRKADGSTKPLLLAVITDGSFGDKWSSRRALIKATEKMQHGDEILVTILKIGNDPKAPKFLNEIDNELLSKYNAKYDIVEVAPFDALTDRGIAGVLSDVANGKRGIGQSTKISSTEIVQ
jgi:hypothetical protein